jgi:hypothetical protein
MISNHPAPARARSSDAVPLTSSKSNSIPSLVATSPYLLEFLFFVARSRPTINEADLHQGLAERFTSHVQAVIPGRQITFDEATTAVFAALRNKLIENTGGDRRFVITKPSEELFQFIRVVRCDCGELIMHERYDGRQLTIKHCCCGKEL